MTTELAARLSRQPVAFRVLAQLAEPGDQTKDPSRPWPANRPMADLGVLELTKLAPDQVKEQQALRLLPNRLTPGIEVSDDPLIDARVRAYLLSFGRRAAP